MEYRAFAFARVSLNCHPWGSVDAGLPLLASELKSCVYAVPVAVNGIVLCAVAGAATNTAANRAHRLVRENALKRGKVYLLQGRVGTTQAIRVV